MSTRVGVISDTHGLVRPQALRALEGSAVILVAGDVGKPSVLEALERVAPVMAIRGNVDVGTWARRLPDQRTAEIAGRRIHLVHDLAKLRIDPGREGIDAVVFGHSHRPTQYDRDGVLFFNPGSAGPRRFSLPIAVGRLHVGPEIVGEIVLLATDP